LPLPGYRTIRRSINLVPGATPAAYQNAVSRLAARSMNTNINGTTNTSNNTRLDGALNMRGSLPAQSLYVPPAESIETVNISTNSFDAEQGFAVRRHQRDHQERFQSIPRCDVLAPYR